MDKIGNQNLIGESENGRAIFGDYMNQMAPIVMKNMQRKTQNQISQQKAGTIGQPSGQGAPTQGGKAMPGVSNMAPMGVWRLIKYSTSS